MAQQLHAPRQLSDRVVDTAPPPPPALKIYYLHPRLAGPFGEWRPHFRRARAMGLNHVCLTPLFSPARNGNIFLTDDHDRTDPVLELEGPPGDAAAAISDLAREFDLGVLVDVVVDRIARDGATARDFPA